MLADLLAILLCIFDMWSLYISGFWDLQKIGKACLLWSLWSVFDSFLDSQRSWCSSPGENPLLVHFFATLFVLYANFFFCVLKFEPFDNYEDMESI